MSTRSKQQKARGASKPTKPSSRAPRKKLLTSGDVRFTAPVGITRQFVSKTPKLTTSGGTIVFRHSEFFGNLGGSTDFNVRAIPVNPGNDQLGPYLSNIAVSWEYYRYRSLRIRYEPSCSTTTTGTVMFCIDYDASDSPPGNKQQLLMNQNAVRSAPWMPVSMSLVKSANDAQIKRFVLDNVPPLGTDPKLYNLGNLFIATEGNPLVTLGELFIDYEVELSVPQGATGEDAGSETTLSTTGYSPTSPLTGSQTLQNDKNPILEVPGTGKVPSLGINSFMRLKKAGQYVFDAYLNATVASGAGSNDLSVVAMPGSGVTVLNPSGGSIGSLTNGAYTLGQYLISFLPQSVTDAANAGLFAIGTGFVLPTLSATIPSVIRMSRRPLPIQYSSSNV